LLNIINTDSKYYKKEDQNDPDDPSKPMTEDLIKKIYFSVFQSAIFLASDNKYIYKNLLILKRFSFDTVYIHYLFVAIGIKNR